MSDEMFWMRLRTMPDLEAEQILRDRRDELGLERGLIRTAHAAAGTAKERTRLQAALSEMRALDQKIGDELHSICKRQDRLAWQKAIREVLGEEAYLQVRAWVIMNEERLKREAA
jgi:hypothetical protein